jgi:hypothetical protein
VPKKRKKQQNPQLKVAEKEEFLDAMNYLEADCLYKKWYGRPDDNHFLLALDCSLPYSSHMAGCIWRAFPEYQSEAVKSVEGRDWAVMLVADEIMDRILELPIGSINEIGEWFHRIKGKRPSMVPLLGCSILGDRANAIWRIEYEPDPAIDPTPSLN